VVEEVGGDVFPVMVRWNLLLFRKGIKFGAGVNLQPNKLRGIGSVREQDGSLICNGIDIDSLLIFVLGNWSCFEEILILAAEKLVQRGVLFLASGGTVICSLASGALHVCLATTDCALFESHLEQRWICRMHRVGVMLFGVSAWLFKRTIWLKLNGNWTPPPQSKCSGTQCWLYSPRKDQCKDTPGVEIAVI
jgi:hypothetical protein